MKLLKWLLFLALIPILGCESTSKSEKTLSNHPANPKITSKNIEIPSSANLEDPVESEMKRLLKNKGQSEGSSTHFKEGSGSHNH